MKRNPYAQLAQPDGIQHLEAIPFEQAQENTSFLASFFIFYPLAWGLCGTLTYFFYHWIILDTDLRRTAIFYKTFTDPFFINIGVYATMAFTASLLVMLLTFRLFRWRAWTVLLWAIVNVTILSVLLEPSLHGFLNVGNQSFATYNKLGQALVNWVLPLPIYFSLFAIIPVNILLLEIWRQKVLHRQPQWFVNRMIVYKFGVMANKNLREYEGRAKKKAIGLLNSIHRPTILNLNHPEQVTVASGDTTRIHEDPPSNIVPFPTTKRVIEPEKPADNVEEYRDLTQATESVQRRFAQARKKKSPTAVHLGKDEEGDNLMANLVPPRHWAAFGSSQSGKTLLLQYLLAQLCSQNSPRELLIAYFCGKNGASIAEMQHLPHFMLIAKADSDSIDQLFTPKLLLVYRELQRRNQLFVDESVSNIFEFNQKMQSQQKPIMPLLFVVIDEASDALSIFMERKNKNALMVIDSFFRKGLSAGLMCYLGFQDARAKLISAAVRDNITHRFIFRQASVEAMQCAYNSRSNLVNPNPENFGAIYMDKDQVDEINYLTKRRFFYREPLEKASVPNGKIANLIRVAEQKYGRRDSVDSVDSSESQQHTVNANSLMNRSDSVNHSMNQPPNHTESQHESTGNDSDESLRISTTNHITEEKLNEAIAAKILAGTSQRDIANEFGITQTLVSRRWQTLRSNIAQLQSEGKQNSEICKSLSITLSTLVSYLRSQYANNPPDNFTTAIAVGE